MSLTIIDEVAGKVSDDIKSATSAIPSRKVKDLRNLLVHAYWPVDPEILWDLVCTHVPVLDAEIRAVLDKAGG